MIKRCCFRPQVRPQRSGDDSDLRIELCKKSGDDPDFRHRFDTNGRSEEAVKKNKVGAGKKLTCLGPKILKIGRRGGELPCHKVNVRKIWG